MGGDWEETGRSVGGKNRENSETIILFVKRVREKLASHYELFNRIKSFFVKFDEILRLSVNIILNGRSNFSEICQHKEFDYVNWKRKSLRREHR